MEGYEIDSILSTMEIVYDTREQPNARMEQRLSSMQVPVIREKLDFGDYTARFAVNNEFITLPVVVERKMSLDELEQCFTRGRDRFAREFDRARDAGAKTYLLVEGGSWGKILNHKYRSKMSSAAFLASLTAWMARYGVTVVFCDARESGRLIKEILYREAKEWLSYAEF